MRHTVQGKCLTGVEAGMRVEVQHSVYRQPSSYLVAGARQHRLHGCCACAQAAPGSPSQSLWLPIAI